MKTRDGQSEYLSKRRPQARMLPRADTSRFTSDQHLKNEEKNLVK